MLERMMYDCRIMLQNILPKRSYIPLLNFIWGKSLCLNGFQETRRDDTQKLQPLPPAIVRPIRGNNDQIYIAPFLSFAGSLRTVQQNLLAMNTGFFQRLTKPLNDFR